jgi:pyruvate dehydrogenase E1 component alpha subunit
MTLIRRFELRVNDMFLRGLIPGTIHLSHGQEATTVGACLALDEKDAITLTHRGHGQALAKGMAGESVLAELLGRRDGCCGGKGGSLHVGDMSIGALPAIAIVGASSPIAVGLAFAYERRKTGQVVCNFFGEGTANKGDWHEALNLAAIWRLPVVFLCENNFYASTTSLNHVMVNEFVADRAGAYGMPGIVVDGNDPLAVYDAVGRAAARARAGDGPTLVECLTYRRGGHKREDPGSYRPAEEVKAWLDRDPIYEFRARLVAADLSTNADLDRIDAEVDELLEEATRFALASEYPDQEHALTNVYA